MCGRYSISTPGQLALRFNLDEPAAVGATYNAAPASELPVVVEREGRRVTRPMRWGLVLHWSRDEQIGARLINARAETVAEKPAYRRAFRRQRCLVPASGFYEWLAVAGGKQPYYIHRKDNDLLALAGLYDTWHDADGQPLETYTIVTTEANDLVAPIHDRMPVILPRDAEAI